MMKFIEKVNEIKEMECISELGLQLYVFLFLNARQQDEHFEYKWKNESTLMGRGDVIFGRTKWAQKLRAPKSTVYLTLKSLEDANLIQVFPKKNYSLVKICGYSEFFKKTAKKKKVGKNKELSVLKTKYMDCVFLTENQFNNLVGTYGECITKECISILNNYIPNRIGQPYKCHYSAIKSWVVAKVQESSKNSLTKSNRTSVDAINRFVNQEAG